MELTFLQVSLRRKNWKSYSQFLVWSVPQVGMTKNRKDFSDGAKKNRELLQTRYLYLIFYNFAILLNSKGSRCRESGLALWSPWYRQRWLYQLWRVRGFRLQHGWQRIPHWSRSGKGTANLWNTKGIFGKGLEGKGWKRQKQREIGYFATPLQIEPNLRCCVPSKLPPCIFPW